MKKNNFLIISVIFMIAAVSIAGCADIRVTAVEPEAAATDTKTETADDKKAAEDGATLNEAEAGESENEAGTDRSQNEAEPEEDVKPEESADDDQGGITVYDRSLNEVSLGEMISQNEVTMLNFWGTFCGPCLGEMPDLAKIDQEYRDKGFGIIGITIDAVDYENGGFVTEILEDADDIAADTGVQYPIVFADDELIQYANITAVPTTYFVDRNGNLLTDPIVGSRSGEDWKVIITELLGKTD